MFLLGFVYASMLEWAVHKYLFHEVGKKKGSVFSFHLRQHHINCLKNGNVDRNFSSRELPGILFLFLTHLPIYFLSPMFYSALLSYGVLFVIVHNTAHIWPKMGRILFPWHWDHHMKYQNHNFNVVVPIADYLFRTRKK
jgi:hypothetical protein